MIRHLSIFTFREGPDKAANIAAVRAYLDTIPKKYPAIVRQTVAQSAAPIPALSDEAPVLFGDLIQIADFQSPEDAAGYPASAAHIGLTEFSSPMLRKVTAIDYVVEDSPRTI